MLRVLTTGFGLSGAESGLIEHSRGIHFRTRGL
jgi:hypothetical protein